MTKGMSPGNNNRGNKRGKASEYEHRKAQAALMWEDRLKGLTNDEIAVKYNVGKRTVTNRFAEFPREGFDRSVPGNPSGGQVSGDIVLTETAAMWEDRVNHRMTNKELAAKYGVSEATVRNRLQGYFPQKTLESLEKHRAREDDKLDMLEQKALEILNTDHYVVDKGQVIRNPYTGEPLVDDAPKLAAMDRILKIIDAKRKLYGLDAPVRAEVKHTTDTSIEIREVADAVAEAHRRNEEKKLRMIQERAQELTEGEEIEDAEVIEDGNAPTEEDR